MVFNATFNNNGLGPLSTIMLGLGFLTPLSTPLSTINGLGLEVYNATFNNNGLGLWLLTPLSTIMG